MLQEPIWNTVWAWCLDDLETPDGTLNLCWAGSLKFACGSKWLCLYHVVNHLNDCWFWQVVYWLQLRFHCQPRLQIYRSPRDQFTPLWLQEGDWGCGNSHHPSSHFPQWLVLLLKAFQCTARMVVPPLELVGHWPLPVVDLSFQSGVPSDLPLTHYLVLLVYFILNTSQYQGQQVFIRATFPPPFKQRWTVPRHTRQFLPHSVDVGWMEVHPPGRPGIWPSQSVWNRGNPVGRKRMIVTVCRSLLVTYLSSVRCTLSKTLGWLSHLWLQCLWHQRWQSCCMEWW
jgi:hypothetical protein